ncbi:DNA primase [Dehalogenimonas formicexedens]|uniref:DNA primase n=1 Tax=Dehalogenimonas formicexedens TaxID=1839801 RepID=A0A1P8F7I5_9CHLR|nr:DNA primase [Dehalogenimonas formicexedens]APV44418.1 DNA primase [Dehalogenimonas formicexedens]
MDVINEIKSRADIAELVSQYTTLIRSGKSLKGLCPFHSEKHGSFFVYPESGTWHCFGACATGGDIFSFLMKKEGLSFSEALERLAEKYGVPLPSRFQPVPETSHRSDLYSVNAAAAQYFHGLLLNTDAAEKARAYLQKRGVNAGSIDSFQLGYALPEWQALKDYLNNAGYTDELLTEAGLLGRSDSGRYYDRFRDQIMFPITDIKGHVTGFGARVLDDSQPKYLNSPETPLFSKSSTLYGISLAATPIRNADAAIIVEGYLDTIISHQYGFTNTVASMGTAINEKQLHILKKLSANLILALDADAAGEEAMARCVPFENLLEREIKVVVAPTGQDPDEVIRADAEHWRRLLTSATPMVDFVFNRSIESADLHTAMGKSDLVTKLLPVVAGINDPVRRTHYLALLASRVGTAVSDLQFSLAQLKLPQPGVRATGQPAKAPPIRNHQTENYFLSILVKHPELRSVCAGFRGEYLESIEDREIYRLCLTCDEPGLFKTRLDPAVWQRLEIVSAGPVAEDRLADRLTECALRLEENYLKAAASKIKEILNAEDNRGSASELLRYKEQGLSLDSRLAELYKRKEERRRSPRR